MKFAALALLGTQMLLLISNVFAAASYWIGPENASVKFTVDHLVLSSVSGRFNEFKGTLHYDQHDITNSSLTGIIKAASIDTNNEIGTTTSATTIFSTCSTILKSVFKANESNGGRVTPY